MKRSVALAILLMLGMGSLAWADAIPTSVDATTQSIWTKVVFNDSGGALTSGTVVVWDNDDTEFDRSGYPYVTTTTSTDSVWVAGVTTDASCPDQSLCTIVVRGPAITRIAQNADVVAEDTLVATSAQTGQAGDYAPAANTCALGVSMELREAYTGATIGAVYGLNNVPMWVYVQPSCQ